MPALYLYEDVMRKVLTFLNWVTTWLSEHWCQQEGEDGKGWTEVLYI